MTREEATICKVYLNDLDRTHDCNEYKLLMALLDREPCEDAVSRQAVLDMAEDMTDQFGNKHRVVTEGLISMLPPVTPTRKVGKWIAERDDYGNITGWHCSNCYDKTGFVTTCAWDYCPSCGSRNEVEE